MFHYLYVSTVDKKKGTHSYKLPVGEGVPNGEEITDLRLAGVFPMAELMPAEHAALLAVAFPPEPTRTSRRGKGKRASA